MWTVAAISFWWTRSPSRLAWSGGLVATSALSLHSSNEPGELSQWLCHDDSTINIISVIINSDDLESFSRSFLTASLSNVILFYSCAAIHEISTDIARRAVRLR